MDKRRDRESGPMPDSHISGAIDSYYEYLLKCAILFDDQDLPTDVE
jgi:hypothetical protein